jgi:hypothetical protein
MRCNGYTAGKTFDCEQIETFQIYARAPHNSDTSSNFSFIEIRHNGDEAFRVARVTSILELIGYVPLFAPDEQSTTNPQSYREQTYHFLFITYMVPKSTKCGRMPFDKLCYDINTENHCFNPTLDLIWLGGVEIGSFVIRPAFVIPDFATVYPGTSSNPTVFQESACSRYTPRNSVAKPGKWYLFESFFLCCYISVCVCVRDRRKYFYHISLLAASCHVMNGNVSVDIIVFFEKTYTGLYVFSTKTKM